jgi:hypothetical protein
MVVPVLKYTSAAFSNIPDGSSPTKCSTLPKLGIISGFYGLLCRATFRGTVMPPSSWLRCVVNLQFNSEMGAVGSHETLVSNHNNIRHNGPQNNEIFTAVKTSNLITTVFDTSS